MESSEVHTLRAGLAFVGAGSMADLDSAIGMLRRSPRTAPGRRLGLQLLASALRARFQVSGSVADLWKCNRALEEIIGGLGKDDPHKTDFELWLGLNLGRVHSLSEDLGSWERCTALLAGVLSTVPELPEETLRELDEVLGEPPERVAPAALERVIECRRGLDRMLSERARTENARALGRLLGERHRRTGSAPDREEAIGLLAGSASEHDDGDLLLLARLRFGRAVTHRAADLDEALGLLSRLLRFRSLPEPEISHARLLYREIALLRCAGSWRDDEEPARTLAGTEAADPGSPLPAVRAIVDRARRARLLGGEPDVEELWRIYDALSGDHHVSREMLPELAMALSDREGTPEELEEAVVILDRALHLLGPSHPLCPEIAFRLAMTLCALFRSGRTGLQRELSVVNGPSGSGETEVYVATVRALLLDRDQEQDEETFGRLEHVLEALPEQHPLYAEVAAVLGTRLAWKARSRVGNGTLERAEHHLETACRLMPDSAELHLLHASHRVLLARHGHGVLLVDQAISGLESLLAGASAADPLYPEMLRTLGGAWRLRGELRAVKEDQDQGDRLVVEAYRRAPAGHPGHDDLRRSAAEAEIALARRAGLGDAI